MKNLMYNNGILKIYAILLFWIEPSSHIELIIKKIVLNVSMFLWIPTCGICFVAVALKKIKNKWYIVQKIKNMKNEANKSQISIFLHLWGNLLLISRVDNCYRGGRRGLKIKIYNRKHRSVNIYIWLVQWYNDRLWRLKY